MSEPMSIGAISTDCGKAWSEAIAAGVRQASRPSTAEDLAWAGATIAQKTEQKGKSSAIGASFARALGRARAQSIALTTIHTPPNRATAEAEDSPRICHR